MESGVEKQLFPYELDNRAAEILLAHGHKGWQGKLTEELAQTLNRGNADALLLLEKLCSKIEENKRDGVQLSAADLNNAARWGLRNLVGIQFRNWSLNNIDFPNSDISKSDVRNAKFTECDFSTASLRELRVAGTRFIRSLLHRADLSVINIADTLIDLEKGATTVGSSVWNAIKVSKASVGVCDDAEEYHTGILHYPMKEGEVDNGMHCPRRGVLIFQDGKPLGYMKLKGDKSFLAMRTVRDEEGNVIFWKGMMYALENQLQNELVEQSSEFKTSRLWRRADMEKIPRDKKSGWLRNNLRFVLYPGLFDRLTVLTESIENGQEEMVDIFA